MKNKVFYIFLILILSNLAYSQSNTFTFDFGYGINMTKMKDVNQNFIHSFANRQDVNLLKTNQQINSMQQFRLGLNYQLTPKFELGIFGSYQFCTLSNPQEKTDYNDYGFPSGEYRGVYNLRINAISTGVSFVWYFSQLLGFDKKENSLNRLQLGVELNSGIGFSNVESELKMPFNNEQENPYSFHESYKSMNFQALIGLKTEYHFTKSPIVSAIGIRLGYQYFQTKDLKNYIENKWNINGNQSINLDFSGIYFGVFLKMGK